MGRKRTRKIVPPAYKVKIGEVFIYRGNLYEQYKNQECVVLGHSKKSRREFDRIQFSDGFEFETIPSTLERKED